MLHGLLTHQSHTKSRTPPTPRTMPFCYAERRDQNSILQNHLYFDPLQLIFDAIFLLPRVIFINRTLLYNIFYISHYWSLHFPHNVHYCTTPSDPLGSQPIPDPSSFSGSSKLAGDFGLMFLGQELYHHRVCGFVSAIS